MESVQVLETLGVTEDWMHLFVTESNLIDPQPGSSSPGSLVYDGHREALLYALHMAANDCYALPHEVYKLMTRGRPVAKGLRTEEVSIGGRSTLSPQLIKRELFLWNRRVYQTVDALRTDDDSIPEDHKREEIWGLHCELMNIHPYDHCNGKVGRILMVNHALLTDAQAWAVSAADRLKYFDTIRRHPSAQWGVTPPEDPQL